MVTFPEMWLEDSSIIISNVTVAFVQSVVSPGEEADELEDFGDAFPEITVVEIFQINKSSIRV